LGIPFDLSKVFFICTANNLEPIRDALRDRMEVIRVSGYSPDEQETIAKNYIIPRCHEEAGFKSDQIVIKDSAVSKLVNSYCREDGVRIIKQLVEKIFRNAALKLVSSSLKKHKKFVVSDKELANYIGRPKYVVEADYQSHHAGVCMSLTWTAAGGSTVYVETEVEMNPSPGRANYIVTGQVGDVIKESTDIAFTLAKKYLAKLDPPNRFFDNSVVHMHLPEGALQKDGSSVALSMVTSLISLALKKPVTAGLAMTGELTLGAEVHPVPAIREKVIAAKRAGVKTIIFPQGNRSQWDKLVSNTIKAGINAVFVKDYSDVLPLAFQGLDLPKDWKQIDA